MDWTIIIAIGALGVSILAALGRSFDKSLSIREHEVFKGNSEANLKLVREEFKSYRRDIRHQLKRIHKELDVITQTRPTTGELQAVSSALEARVDAIVKVLANGKEE